MSTNAIGLKIKTQDKMGLRLPDYTEMNHIQTIIKVKTNVKAGGFTVNHSQTKAQMIVKSGIKAGTASSLGSWMGFKYSNSPENS